MTGKDRTLPLDLGISSLPVAGAQGVALSIPCTAPGPLDERTIPLTRSKRSVTPTRLDISAKSF
jgi:hypothetical protein